MMIDRQLFGDVAIALLIAVPAAAWAAPVPLTNPQPTVHASATPAATALATTRPAGVLPPNG